MSGQLLCSWNAFVLQSIGENLLDADYAADPRTAGYVPPVTHTQVTACFDQVEPWTSRARQAAGNPGFDVVGVVRLPAALPDWAEAEPRPLPHLRGMLEAVRIIRMHAEVALGALEASVQDTEEHRSDLRRLHQLAAEGATAADYADGLLNAAHEPRLHEAVEQRLRCALDCFHRLGQLTAMPTLIARHGTVKADARGNRLPIRELPTPDSSAFDPWCLTAPQARPRWRKNPQAQRSIEELWEFDPAPVTTLRIQDEIDAARRGGAIDYARDKTGGLLGSYFACPWGAVYTVRRPVTINGRRLRLGQQFTYAVNADKIREGGEFTRRLIVGRFSHTDEVQYSEHD
ncbi:hypothetical protein AB0L06_17580 [Spirillospora sp. NPDC052269]